MPEPMAKRQPGTKPAPSGSQREPASETSMKKILYALAGYAFYKWWSKRSQEEQAAAALRGRR